MLDYTYEKENFISFEKVKELWSKNTRDTVLYLHNPFCFKNNCKYCAHPGYPNPNIKEVKKFYNEYMPKQLKKYEDIINNQNIKLIDFGGGTPNFLNAKDFDNFLNLLPKKLVNTPKIIELHPAYISKDFIDILKKYNFTTLIFCIQTFNKAILKENNRASHDSKNVFECMHYAKKLGFNIATDIITYWHKTESDWETLEKDLYILKWLEPDEITISVLYQNKYNCDFNGVKVYKNISNIIKKILPNYINPENTLSTDFNVAATRIYKPKSKIIKEFEIYINSLTCVPWEDEQGYSTLGIGSYKCKNSDVFSIIGPNYVIYELNNDFNEKYYLAKNYNFWDSAHKEIDRLKNLLKDEPPVGSSLLLTNIVKNKGIFYKGFIQGNCESKFIKRNGYMSKKEIEVYNKFMSSLSNNSIELIY